MTPRNPLLPFYESIRTGTISAETRFNHAVTGDLFFHRIVVGREDAGAELIRVKFDPPHFGQSDSGNLYDAERLFSNYQWATEMKAHGDLREGTFVRGAINVSAAAEPLLTFHGLRPVEGDLDKAATGYMLWRGLLAGNVQAVLPVLKYFEQAQGREVRPSLPGARGMGKAVEIVSRLAAAATIDATDNETVTHNVGVEMTVLRIVAGDQLTDPDNTQVNVDFRFGQSDGSRMNIRAAAVTPEPIPMRQNFGSELAAGDLAFPIHFDTTTKVIALLAVPASAGASARPHLKFVGLPGPPEVAIPALAIQIAALSGHYLDQVPWAPGRTVANLWDQYRKEGL